MATSPEVLFDIRLGAELACFSRPELKVERVSYPVMTPSAARGFLEAIFWKPEIRWEVREIWLLKPVRFTTLLRNELESRQGGAPQFVEEQRQQRMSLLLKDVEYVVRAAMIRQPHAESALPKYEEQARRRVERGQFHHAPYLGCREFSAWFEPASAAETPFPVDMHLGPMLFDLAFCESDRRELSFLGHDSLGRRERHGHTEAVFFDAVVRGGVMAVPPAKYDEVRRRAAGHA